MGRPRRRVAPGLRAAAAQEERMEEPEPGELRVAEEADEFQERRLEEAVLAALGSEQESGGEEEEEALPLQLPEDSEEEEEVEEEGEDDEDDAPDMDSDLEEQQPGGGSGLPHELAWGQRKQLYYGADSGGRAPRQSQEEAAAEEEEEQEAQAVQRRLAQALGEEDFGLGLLQAFERPRGEASGQRVAQDLQALSAKEQLRLLRKEAPELLELMQDFQAKLRELRDELEPLLCLVRERAIPRGRGSRYLQTKYHLYLNYCCNVSFYLLLKAKRVPVHGHPVIERLLTYRSLINDLAVVDQKLSPELRLLLGGLRSKDGGGLTGRKESVGPARKLSHKARPRTVPEVAGGELAEEAADGSDLDEEAALDYYREMEEKIKLKKKRKREQVGDVEEVAVEEEMEGQKRGATYQIVKNKGLTPRRKKVDRNPRVKHREKFRRAKIRRKGQVREVRREEQRYGGELSGIRAGVKKSVKLK
ncbi:something about silencing protein 10 [Tiliqua scincoides]|uniref:something about silencing protein 10 n=1 Tax=Tiliqua scincoides TaxID=71010 RepID=UPI0034625566